MSAAISSSGQERMRQENGAIHEPFAAEHHWTSGQQRDGRRSLESGLNVGLRCQVAEYMRLYLVDRACDELQFDGTGQQSLVVQRIPFFHYHVENEIE